MFHCAQAAFGLTLVALLATTAYAGEQSARFEGGKFVNTAGKWRPDYGRVLSAMLTEREYESRPGTPLPLRRIPQSDFLEAAGARLYRLGHSTVLIQLDGEYLLTDPVFSKRASPVQWAGPARFHAPPISIEALPRLKAVVISHDHYDHLDRNSIIALANKVEFFVTPSKVGDHLRRWGIDDDRIVELNWWQHVDLGSIRLTATPAQHFSGRGLHDRDRTLWASWVIRGEEANLFFSGDTGYFAGFKDIGKRLGPFDVTMLEAGAYNPAWAAIHMLPEHTLQAHIDLRGEAMLPIHNSTFDLSNHDWFEPLEVLDALALRHEVQLLTPMFGQPVSLQSPTAQYAWWRESMPVIAAALYAD
jgi:L-ascorbate metabolism protein UlaG (beta-lactamase superfamily)